MNIYQKLQLCRVELQNMNLRKSGQNKFAGYEYYELCDFLPTINKLMLDNGMTSTISFNGCARLTIINAEKPDETIVFESPIADAPLKGCHPIQNLGAAQTYLRRYLYSNAFEIVEHDALDATTGKPDKSEQKATLKEEPKSRTINNGTITDGQAKRIFAIAKGNTDLVKEICGKHGYTSSKDIKKSDYDKIIDEVQKSIA